MLKGFKDFILRGNVIELSIAVVVGTAFTALVSAFTSNIVNPIIAAAGGVETEGLGFPIWPGNDKTFVNIGAVITAFVTFLITAAVVYFIFVAPMNRINSGQEAPVNRGAGGRPSRRTPPCWPRSGTCWPSSPARKTQPHVRRDDQGRGRRPGGGPGQATASRGAGAQPLADRIVTVPATGP